MASWQTISRENLRAARLLRESHFRSCASRSYYAAFSAVAAQMQRVAHEFPKGWETPRHRDISRLLDQHGDPAWQEEVKNHMSSLYKLRIAADYDSGSRLESAEASAAIKLASRVSSLVGTR